MSSQLKQSKTAQDKRVYTNWVNAQFHTYRREPIQDLFEDFKTGLKLAELLLLLTKEEGFGDKKLNDDPKNKINNKENCQILLDWLQVFFKKFLIFFLENSKSKTDWSLRH
jgi:hypothetical protein